MKKLEQAPAYAPLTEDGTDTKFSRIWRKWFIDLVAELKKWYVAWEALLVKLGGLVVYHNNVNMLYAGGAAPFVGTQNIFCQVGSNLVISGTLTQVWAGVQPTWTCSLAVDGVNVYTMVARANWQDLVTLTSSVLVGAGPHTVTFTWNTSTAAGTLETMDLTTTILPVF